MHNLFNWNNLVNYVHNLINILVGSIIYNNFIINSQRPWAEESLLECNVVAVVAVIKE